MVAPAQVPDLVSVASQEPDAAKRQGASWRSRWIGMAHQLQGVECVDVLGRGDPEYRLEGFAGPPLVLLEDADDTADGQVVYCGGLVLAGYLCVSCGPLGKTVELGAGVGVSG